MAEVKLGKSLDSIIEENRRKLTTKKRGDKPKPAGGGVAPAASKPKGMRIDGPRKNLRVQGLARPQSQSQPPRGAQRGSGMDAGLGVRSAGIKKRSNRPAAYTYDEDMDTGEYGGTYTAPPRRQQQHMPRGGARGMGGPPIRQRDAPRGDSNGFWSHDLYDEREQGPPRRARQMPMRQNAQSNGVTLTVSNLDFTVSDKDIKELFETCGPLLDAFIHYDNSGRSEGLATIVYASRAHADKAIAEYDGVKLDGKELTIQYAEEAEQPVVHLSSGKIISRPMDGPRGPPVNPRRAVAALPVRGMGGDRVEAAGGRMGGGYGGGMSRGMGGGMGGGARGRPAGRGGPMAGRLRSTVGKSKADLDAEMDAMQE